MEEWKVAWIEFVAILVAVAAVVCCMFHTLLSVRWLHREKRMNKILDELSKDPYMITHVYETKTDLDCKIGEFRRVAFT